MGCLGSREFILNEDIPGQDSIAVETFQLLELSDSDINCFWKAFIDMDADDSGTIRADEFFAYFHIENTILNSKIFMTMDSDHSGYLNFCEFVCAMWNFLGMDPNFLGALAFYIFDSDGTNSLEYAEIKNLVETIHHKTDKNTAVKKLIESIMHNHSTVSVDYFTKCCQEMQSLCAPLIGMQQSLREQIVGARFWIDLAAKRGLDPIRSRPNYIKTISDSISEKNLQKKIAEIEKRRQDQESERVVAVQKKKHASSTTGRRRSSILFEYFTSPEKANQHPHQQHPPGHLPQKARARRSSITLLKPSLLKNEPQVKTKPSKSKAHGHQVQPDFNDIGQSNQENSEGSVLIKPAISNLNLNFATDAQDTDPTGQSHGQVGSPDPHQHKHKGNGTPNSHNNHNNHHSHSDKSTKSRLHKAESADSVKPSKSHLPKSESLGDSSPQHVKSSKSKLSKTESSDTHHNQESKENKSSTKHTKRSDSNNGQQSKKSTKS